MNIINISFYKHLLFFLTYSRKLLYTALKVSILCNTNVSRETYQYLILNKNTNCNIFIQRILIKKTNTTQNQETSYKTKTVKNNLKCKN